MLAGGDVQVDGMPIAYFVPGQRNTRAGGYPWTYARPGGNVLFDWQSGRGARRLEHVIPGSLMGTLQCDGYKGYPAFVHSRPGGSKITLAGCRAHVRRKLREVLAPTSQLIGWLPRQLDHLYRIKKDLRRSRAGPRQRAAGRAHQSRPIQERLRRALVRLKPCFVVHR